MASFLSDSLLLCTAKGGVRGASSLKTRIALLEGGKSGNAPKKLTALDLHLSSTTLLENLALVQDLR